MTNLYVWGMDIGEQQNGTSGVSTPGKAAGGVGGLLARYAQSTSPVLLHFYAYDANGNVAGLFRNTGYLMAQYNYDAYGNLVSYKGGDSYGEKANSFLFSTKFRDESGLYYYGYRFYSAELGRWVSRDPVGELGFLLDYIKKIMHADRSNLLKAFFKPCYLFVENNTLTHYDYLGLKIDCKCGIEEGSKASEEAKEDNPWTEKTENTRDALMHCYVGARIAAKCNQETAVAGGVLKEVIDLLGDDTDAEPRDYRNTKMGANLCGGESTAEGAKTCCQKALEDGLLEPMGE